MSITITSLTFVWGTTLTTILSSTRTDYFGTGTSTSTFAVQITTSIETWISVPTTITINSKQSSSSSIFTSSASSLYTSTGTTTSDPVSSTNSTSTKGLTSSSSTKHQPPPTGTNVPSSKGVSTSAAVGIGIGTTFAGAFLALLTIWIFFRRSRRSRRGGQNSCVSDTNHERGFGGVRKRVSSSIVALEDVPLDPADDSQIRKHMQDLYELIHQHAENHYSARNFEGRRQDLQLELAICGWSDGGGTAVGTNNCFTSRQPGHEAGSYTTCNRENHTSACRPGERPRGVAASPSDSGIRSGNIENQENICRARR